MTSTQSAICKDEETSLAASDREMNLVRAYAGESDCLALSRTNCLKLAASVEVARILVSRGYECTGILGSSIYVLSRETSSCEGGYACREKGPIACINNGAIKNLDHGELARDSELVAMLRDKGISIRG